MVNKSQEYALGNKCASHEIKIKMLTTNADMIVVTEAPMNPSQVFFGDNLINGVLPKKNPKKYAAISLITISVAGRRNLHIFDGASRKSHKIGRQICPQWRHLTVLLK